MSITFAKAPLVELIAELRWGQPQQLGPNPIGAFSFPGQVFGLNPNKNDEFFMRFGGEIYQRGLIRPNGLFLRASRLCSFNLYSAIVRARKLTLQCCFRLDLALFPRTRSGHIVHGRPFPQSCKRELWLY